MKLWLISQFENGGYDTYDSAVVAANDEAEARMITPDGDEFETGYFSVWASSPENVHVKFIGDAAPGIEGGVVLASFNAG